MAAPYADPQAAVPLGCRILQVPRTDRKFNRMRPSMACLIGIKIPWAPWFERAQPPCAAPAAQSPVLGLACKQLFPAAIEIAVSLSHQLTR